MSEAERQFTGANDDPSQEELPPLLKHIMSSGSMLEQIEKGHHFTPQTSQSDTKSRASPRDSRPEHSHPSHHTSHRTSASHTMDTSFTPEMLFSTSPNKKCLFEFGNNEEPVPHKSKSPSLGYSKQGQAKHRSNSRNSQKTDSRGSPGVNQQQTSQKRGTPRGHQQTTSDKRSTPKGYNTDTSVQQESDVLGGIIGGTELLTPGALDQRLLPTVGPPSIERVRFTTTA